MKIATPHCGFAPESNSGGETYERELLKSMARFGVQFEVILAKGKSYPQGFPQFHVHEVPIRKGLRWYVSNWIWPHYLKKIEKSCGFDMLRIHSLRYTGPGVLWFNRFSKKKYPVVCHHHHIDPSPLNSIIEKRVINASDLLITGSQFSKRQLMDKFGIEPQKIAVVPYGIDEKFVPQPVDPELKKKLGLTDEKVLLFLAGLKKRKKVFFLIDIFEALKRTYHDPLKLVIVGSGPLKSELESYVAGKHLTNDVIFTGYIQEADKIKYYNLCDLFVFPSEMEGFGFSPAEAMACGKPCVISDSGSLPEIVEDGKSGFAVPNRTELFVEKILELLRNQAKCESMGRSGAERARKLFIWSVCAKNTLEVYENLLYEKNRISN